MSPVKRTAALVFCLLLGCGLGRAQLVIGQYEDEAPVRTWNTFGIPGAATMGLGGTQFAVALDAASIFANPAASTRLPGICFTARGSYVSAELFRYAVVNTGVVTSSGNLNLGLWALDSAALTFRVGGWGFGLGYGLLEAYNRPAIDISPYASYTFHFDQTGELRVLHFSVARAFGSRVAVGVGLNAVSGPLDHKVEDDIDNGAEVIFTAVSQKYSGVFVNGGALVDLTPELHLALVARSPYTKSADSTSLISRVVVLGRDFQIQASSQDEYRQPFAAGLGLSYDLDPDWFAACDVTYFAWSAYKVTYFGQALPRDFRDVVRVSLGTEYSGWLSLFGWRLRLPVRAGFQVDPQPMKDPRSTYYYYSIGTGIHGRHVFLDIGLMSGKESGSGRSLTAKTMLLSLGATL